MTNEVKHTPTPWVTNKLQVKGSHLIQSRPGGEVIASVSGFLGSPVLMDRDGEGWANAEFIVRAVNAHDELVEIAKECLDRMEKGQEFHLGTKGKHFGWLEKVRAALAKAEGRVTPQ